MSRKQILGILLPLVVLVAVAAAGVLLVGSNGPGAEETTQPEIAVQSATDGATETLAQPAPLEASPTLGMSGDEAADFVPELTPPAPGTLSSVSLTMPDDLERRYLYSVPGETDPQEPLPVLLAMGGWTDPPENFRDYAGFSDTAAREAVVVYPAGVADAWAGAPYSETSVAEDISFLRAVVAQLATALPVDRERIYAVGMSNGGGMALELACHAPDLVAGVSAVSAAFYEGIDEGCHDAPVATQIIHGTEDELLHYDGGVLHDVPYLGVVEMVRHQAAQNGCSEQPAESTAVGDNADRLIARDCEAPTEHIRVNGGFHDWFIDPSTQEETWAFLSAQRAEGN